MKFLAGVCLLVGALSAASCAGGNDNGVDGGVVNNGDPCSAGCTIDGVCYPSGVTNPANDCQVCDAAASATAWSNADGTTCDDGSFCTTNDTCSAGVCAGVARDCSDGVACNGAETCDETADRCAAGTSTCDEGSLCDFEADACIPSVACPGCTIDGTCYGQGQVDPNNPCLVCDTAQSTTAFVNHDGATCDDGLFCTTGDVCGGGTCAGTGTVSCSDGISCNGTEACDEATDRCVFGPSGCGVGYLCNTTSDTCELVCSGGTTKCGNTCVDIDHDPNNCGGCGNAPNPGDHICTSDANTPVCIAGTCDEACGGSVTFSYTGASQTFTVPSCTNTIRVDVRGAQGGAGFSTVAPREGGLGGRTQATLTVSPTDVVTVFVGGVGANGISGSPGAGGFNGGAIGSSFSNQRGGGGGGASDIRVNGVGLADRVVVAGGGGGTGVCNNVQFYGGVGGGLNGGPPAPKTGCNGMTLPTPGTQSAGGSGGQWSATWCAGSAGVLGLGGAGCNGALAQSGAGGGGGGGFYGGGGGGNYGGAGGSGYAAGSATNVVHTPGYQGGNGEVIISW
ncbi:MAG: glycine-rich protein [Kofleriaceae bacterium]